MEDQVKREEMDAGKEEVGDEEEWKKGRGQRGEGDGWVQSSDRNLKKSWRLKKFEMSNLVECFDDGFLDDIIAEQ